MVIIPTADECSCPAHAADECIRRRDGLQDDDAASCQITLDTCSINSSSSLDRSGSIATAYTSTVNSRLILGSVHV